MKNPIIIYGVGSGFIIALLSTLTYFLRLDPASIFSTVLNFSTYGILFSGIYFGALHTRRQENNDKAIFTEAYGWCAQVVLFISITISLFTLLYFIIDPAAKEIIIAAAQEQIDAQDISDQQAETVMQMSNLMSNPFFLTLSAFCSYGVIGLLVSLLAAALIKNEKRNPF